MRNIVAGNWKSNKLLTEAQELVNAILVGLPKEGTTQVILAPPAPYLALLTTQAGSEGHVNWAAQQCSAFGFGAYTGEVSANMYRSAGADSVIIGHSERRAFFGESDEVVALKVKSALQAGLQVIWCCGEPLEMRESGSHESWVLGQLNSALVGLPQERLSQLVIAYEPIWAIGTGLTASAEQAQSMHLFIREHVKALFGSEVSTEMQILYGGSCKPSNAEELFGQPDVNGGLIGGAALNASDFLAIVAASNRSNNQS